MYIYIYYSGMHKGGPGGARSPAPLRSEAKVPLRSSLCDINDINMQSMLFA